MSEKHEQLRGGLLLIQIFQNQLKVVGKTYADVENDDNFRFNMTITRKQYELFKKDTCFLIKKKLKINGKKARESFDWFYSNFGLRIKD